MKPSSSFEPFADRLRRFTRDMGLPLVIGHVLLSSAGLQVLSQAGPVAGAPWGGFGAPWLAHGTPVGAAAGVDGAPHAGACWVAASGALRGLALTGSGGTFSPRMTAAYCGSPGRTTLASLLASLYCAVRRRLDHDARRKHDAVELLQSLDHALLLRGRALILGIEAERAIDHGAERALRDVPAFRLSLLVELCRRPP